MVSSVSIVSILPVLACPGRRAGLDRAPLEHDRLELDPLHERATSIAPDPIAGLALARELETVLPFPGARPGACEHRWSALATLGAADLSVARAVEAHLDAAAILAEAERAGEIDRAALPTGTWGVFAAESPHARLEAHEPEHAREPVVVSGTKSWCSLARHVDTALVTAWTGSERGLFAVSMRSPGVRVDDESPWVSRGLRAVESAPVTFDRVPATPVGAPGWYLRRSGFAWGGIGVAAVWFGATVALARRLLPAPGAQLDALTGMHLGEAERTLRPVRALLGEAARLIDDRALDGVPDAPQQLAWTVRAAVARAADEVVARVLRATGPAPLAFDEEHARRVADLGIYVRQEHGERDTAALGTSLGSALDAWPSTTIGAST